MQETLTRGIKAPDFQLPSLRHGSIGPADYAGRENVVLAFYPRDNSSG